MRITTIILAILLIVLWEVFLVMAVISLRGS